MLTVPSIPTWADRLNAHCFCMSVDQNRLNAALEKQGGVNDIWPSLRTTHPHLFADNPAFVSASDMDAMAKAVAAIEKLSKLPKFKDLALAAAPHIEHQDFGPRGLLMGYDFHITPADKGAMDVWSPSLRPWPCKIAIMHCVASRVMQGLLHCLNLLVLEMMNASASSKWRHNMLVLPLRRGCIFLHMIVSPLPVA